MTKEEQTVETKEETYQDVLERYSKEVEEYTTSIEKMSVEELKAQEAELIPVMDAWDKELKSKEYSLSDVITWQGHTYTRAQIGNKIIAILRKFECEYKYTLGMWQMADWWSNTKSSIDFSTLDSTLRVLGNPAIKYKGPSEWENILIINAYFETCNDAYQKDTLKTYMLADKHNAILDALKLNTPVVEGSETEQQEEGEMVVEES